MVRSYEFVRTNAEDGAAEQTEALEGLLSIFTQLV